MERSVLYLECHSGISGDMTVAALLDLGANRQVLLDALASLPLTGYSIEIKDVLKSGLRACDFNVILEHDNHDHDMEYLHGTGHVHAADAPHAHEHTHAVEFMHDPHMHAADMPHAHEHVHAAESMHGSGHTHAAGAPHAHAHESRNLRDVTEIINAGKLTDSARELVLRIFHILAEAEASVHGKSVDEVHFHEVGAVDSIIDIVAVAVCLDNLHPSRVVVSPLTDGTGQIRCQHGLIPVPVPAVTAIAAQNGLSLKLTEIEGELVTPTGAAIAAALQSDAAQCSGTAPHSGAAQCSGTTQHSDTTPQSNTAQCSGTARQSASGLPAEFRIRKIGLGAGKRDYATAGVLRAMLLEPQCTADDKAPASQTKPDNLSDDLTETARGNDDSADTILSLESNIDDCTGEALSFTMQELLAHGALDVFYVPIYMKKNRPAYLLRVLCRADQRTALESIIFKNTTTIGIRVQEMQRTKLPRQVVSLETPWGRADVKYCTHNDETYCYPENDSVSALARKNRIGFPEMYHQIQEYAKKHAKIDPSI